jgi:hypothetical protein|tara:strand:- start:322 stop:840 length:519 start_codon:yes stop_codon:yes gene_type:complete
MNIFYLDKDPAKAASYFYDKHKVKMILESAQMLCTAHHHYGNGDNVPYKKAHYNHPSTIWCRQNSSQYMWLYNHMIALGKEYTKRYNKTHLTIIKCKDVLKQLPPAIPDSTFTEPPQCMPDHHKVPDCSITAYWNYYEQDKYTVANKNEKFKFRPHEIIYAIHNGSSNYIPC